MDKFSSILFSKWIKGPSSDVIIGYWAEDGSTYEITCPSQLRDTLVDMQNVLADRYAELEGLRKALREMTWDIDRIFK